MTSSSATVVQGYLPLVMSAIALVSIPVAIAVVGGALYFTVLQPDDDPDISEVIEEPAAPTTGTIRVLVVPDAVISYSVDGSPEVEVGDGEPTSRWTGEEIEPGAYEITLTSEGYEPVTKTVLLTPGKEISITEALVQEEGSTSSSTRSAPVSSATPARTPPPEPEPSGTGTLKVSISGGVGWARVFVDGEEIGRAPGSFDVPAGSHLVEVRNSEVGISHSETKTVTAGDSTTVRVTPMF